ncbi:hypothetical protein B0H19DRAFT_1074215 [Mycena capillaripes]|nr:hypothetical protein B0H19DRAFT_1074215 [Mycena capillaripes]
MDGYTQEDLAEAENEPSDESEGGDGDGVSGVNLPYSIGKSLLLARNRSMIDLLVLIQWIQRKAACNTALPSDKYSAPAWGLDDVFESTSIRGQVHRRRLIWDKPMRISSTGRTFLVSRVCQNSVWIFSLRFTQFVSNMKLELQFEQLDAGSDDGILTGIGQSHPTPIQPTPTLSCSPGYCNCSSSGHPSALPNPSGLGSGSSSNEDALGDSKCGLEICRNLEVLFEPFCSMMRKHSENQTAADEFIHTFELCCIVDVRWRNGDVQYGTALVLYLQCKVRGISHVEFSDYSTSELLSIFLPLSTPLTVSLGC